jgi:hypothetical protein
MSEATEVVTQVLQIIPELQELHEESSMVFPMQLGSLHALTVAMTPSPPPFETCQSPALVESGGLDASATLLFVSIGHVVSLSNEVDKAGVLAPNSKALVAKELSDLLVSLEAASPGYGMEIACVLAGKASKELVEKVEKVLKSKRKKRVIIWKDPQLLD